MTYINIYIVYDRLNKIVLSQYSDAEQGGGIVTTEIPLTSLREHIEAFKLQNNLEVLLSAYTENENAFNAILIDIAPR
jgi:hypothetical protein